MSTTTEVRGARRGAPQFCCGKALADGVRNYRGRLRVRLTFPEIGTHADYFPATPEGVDLANLRIAELRQMRRHGVTPDAAVPSLTLGQWALEQLDRKLADPDLAEGTRAWWRRILTPWIDGPYAPTPIHLLPVMRLRGDLRARCATHPKAGRDEWAALQTTIRLARSEGAAIPERLLDDVPPRAKVKRKREALSAEARDLLALSAPPIYGRLIAIQARVGNRIGELLLQECDRVDLAGGTVTVEEEIAKERREKIIPLLDDELALYAEQLGALRVAVASPTCDLPTTPPGSRLVWPMPDGRAWPLVNGAVANAYFQRACWTPAVTAAQAAWRERYGLSPVAVTPFDTITSHDLRVTAVTAMMDLGMSEATCAFRVGHKDAKLIRSIYDQGDRAARARRELDALEALRATASDAATTPRGDDAAAQVEG